MNCEQAGELLVDLLYGELEGPAREELLAHIASCRRCADEYAAMRRARAALGLAAAKEPPMRPVMIGEEPARAAAARHVRIRRIMKVVVSAAAALVLIAVGVLVHQQILPTAVAKDMPIEIKRTGVSLTILSRPPEWDRYGDQLPGFDGGQSSGGVVQANMTADFEQTGWSRWPGLALVRDQRVIRHIRPGQAEVRFTDVPAGIWPDTVRLRCLDGGQDLVVVEQNYQFDLASAAAVLAKHVDREIGVLFKDGKSVSGTLLSHDEATLVIRPAGEGPRSIARRELAAVTFEKLPQGLLTTPTLVWQLANSGRAAERSFEVDYLTTGLSWRADYVVKLRPAEIPGSEQSPGATGGLPASAAAAKGDAAAIIDLADLVGYATVTNASGVTYEDAQLKLMAGDVNLLMRPILYRQLDEALKWDEDRGLPAGFQPQMVEKSFFEYHLYTLTRPATIANNETKQLEMVSGRGLALRRGYIYDPTENPTAARVVSEMENTEENGLGKPLPKGVVRLYAPDPEGVSTYVGQTTIDHTPVKEKLRLAWGHAFDIACDVRETDARHNGADHRITTEYTLRNHKPHDVTVTVIVHVPPSTYAAECAIAWHVREVGIVEVPVTLPAGREVKFAFSHSYNDRSGGGLRSPHDKQ